MTPIETELMAECMARVRKDLIAANVFDKNKPLAMIPDAVAALCETAKHAAAWRTLFWKCAAELNCVPSSYVDANANDHVLRQAKADAADARRYRTLCESGLPLCFKGDEFHSKKDFDSAIDADVALDKLNCLPSTFVDANANDHVLRQAKAYAADARRYRTLCESGLPLCFKGDDFRSKKDFDAAIDADVALDSSQGAAP
jgi:uncharacterized protein with PIN domain